MATSQVTPQATADPYASIAQPVTSTATADPYANIAQPVSGSAPGTVTGNDATISNPSQPTSTMGKLAQWIDNVTLDMKDGGDRTGVGTVMQKLGAHGLDMGQNEKVGDFIASLPLGLLKAAKGAAELVPSEIGGEKGNTWKGVKDLVSGGLQAVQEPAAFVAPEESAISDEGLLNDAANVVAKTTTPITNKVSALATNIPKQTESKLVDAIGDIAEDNGFARSEDAETIGDATKHLATSFQQRAQAAYKALDDAAPGFQELRDKISSLAQAAKNQLNVDPEKAEVLNNQLTQAKQSMSDLLSDDLQEAWQAADKDYSQYKALQKFVGKANASATDLTSDALTDVGRLKSGMQSLGNVSRKGTPTDVLAKGFGDEGADTLRQIVQDAAQKTADKASAKNLVTKAAYGAGVAGGGYELYKALFGGK